MIGLERWANFLNNVINGLSCVRLRLGIVEAAAFMRARIFFLKVEAAENLKGFRERISAEL